MLLTKGYLVDELEHNDLFRLRRPIAKATAAAKIRQGGPGCRIGLPGRRSRKRPAQPKVYHDMPLVPSTPIGPNEGQSVSPHEVIDPKRKNVCKRGWWALG